MKFLNVSATTDGDNELVAAADVPDDKRIRVINYAVNANAAGVFKFQTTEATPTVLATFELADSASPQVFNGTNTSPAFDLPLGVGLEINVANSMDVLGHLCYMIV